MFNEDKNKGYRQSPLGGDSTHEDSKKIKLIVDALAVADITKVKFLSFLL